MVVVIPAAGLGRRFLPRFPKELLPLGGRPLIDHAVDEAFRAGFDEAVVVISPAKRELAEHLACTPNLIPVRIVEQPLPLGPGDAVLRAAAATGLSTFGVLFPDDVVLADDHWPQLLAVAAVGNPALCVREVEPSDVSRFGMADCEETAYGLVARRLVEKPRPGDIDSILAIFGRYVVTREVLDALLIGSPEGELQLTAGFDAVARLAGVRAIRFDGQIFDCGTPAEYARAMRRFPVPTAQL